MILHGDCMEQMKTLEANSVDAIVTDPPYGWRFMGKAWDGADIEKIAKQGKRPGETFVGSDGSTRQTREYMAEAAGKYDLRLTANQSFQSWTELWAKEAFRVLKPGGHVLVFCGPRTYHRMASGVEDSGFEIRDQLQWIFGSGFPKSHNIGDGRGTALKPANEPIVLARKPLSESTVAKNVLKWGTGALNIEATRIGSSGGTTRGDGKRQPGTSFDVGNFGVNDIGKGRWPANILFDEAAAEMLDEQSGSLKGPGNTHRSDESDSNAIVKFNKKSFSIPGVNNYPGQVGGASRFFYVAKTSKSERNRGLEGLEGLEVHRFGAGIGQGKDPNAPTIDKNHHPTVKPIKLMEYLIKLVTPPNGIVLDPFMGSGSTGVAAKNLGFEFIGCEMNDEYIEIAKRRIDAA